jgi:hypothetical protein
MQPHELLNDPIVIGHMPDYAGVYFDDETSEYVVTYRNQEERIHTSENPDVHMLLEMAQRLATEDSAND